MSIQHSTIESNGRIFDRIERAESGVSLTVARTGAEMVSLRLHHPDGREAGFLYRDGETAPPASGWANHATVMGYFLHRLWNGVSNYRGHTIRGGNHGFLRGFAFDAPAVGDEGLVYHVPAEKIPADAYPLRVSLELAYRLPSAPGTLEITFSFKNHEPSTDAHLSFGLHPGFAVSDMRNATISLPPGKYLRHIAPGNFLNGETQEFSHPGGPMPFSKEGLPDSYLVEFLDVPDRVIRLSDPVAGREVDLDFSECPVVTLWSEGENYVCIEPCWGLPDNNPPLPFEHKAQIQHIEPQGFLKKTFRLRARMT